MSEHRYHPRTFDLAAFDANRPEIMLAMSRYFLRYLNQLYSIFGSDLAMVIVLGEIAHHNASNAYPDSAIQQPIADLDKDPSRTWEKMPGCNALSLSAATGIPRETVRRKIKQLIELGWLSDSKTQGIRITPAVADHFGRDFNPRQLDDLLTAAGKLLSILKRGKTANGNHPPSTDPHHES